MKRALERAFITLENAYIVMNRMLLEMNVKCASDEVLERNDKHVLGTWKKEDLCHELLEIWLNCVLLLNGKHDV